MNEKKAIKEERQEKFQYRILPPTAREVILARINNPCATMQDIGSKLNISRQRVEQILLNHRLATKKWHAIYICNSCGNEIDRKIYHSSYFCSGDCRREFYKQYRTVVLTCSYCGKQFNRRLKRVNGTMIPDNQTTFFCDKKCQGKYAASHYSLFKKGYNTGYRDAARGK